MIDQRKRLTTLLGILKKRDQTAAMKERIARVEQSLNDPQEVPSTADPIIIPVKKKKKIEIEVDE